MPRPGPSWPRPGDGEVRASPEAMDTAAVSGWVQRGARHACQPHLPSRGLAVHRCELHGHLYSVGWPAGLSRGDRFVSALVDVLMNGRNDAR
jgi:hypothetical protein